MMIVMIKKISMLVVGVLECTDTPMVILLAVRTCKNTLSIKKLRFPNRLVSKAPVVHQVQHLDLFQGLMLAELVGKLVLVHPNEVMALLRDH